MANIEDPTGDAICNVVGNVDIFALFFDLYVINRKKRTQIFHFKQRYILVLSQIIFEHTFKSLYVFFFKFRVV